MSETKTIEERYEDIKRHEGLFGTYTRNAIALLDYLMAERKSVDLDTLFPKEVMEKAGYFIATTLTHTCEPVHRKGDMPKDAIEQLFRTGVIFEIVELTDDVKIHIEPYNKVHEKIAPRVRIRLGLTVQKVED